MKTTYLVWTIGFVLTVMVGCKKDQSEEAQVDQTAAVVPVSVSTVRQGDIAVSIDAVGQTEALRKETVLSPVAGTIVSHEALEGTAVRAGDTLAVIQTKESQAAITGAQTLLAAATSLEQKKEAERALKLARTSQTLMSIEAKRSGIVSSRSVVEGSLVAEGSELLNVVDPASVVFVAQVPLKNLALITREQAAHVTFTSVSGMTFNAVVSAINPGSDPQTQTVRVVLSFVNITPEQRVYMKDGIAGVARIVAGARTNVLLVPTRALLRNDDNNTYTIVTVTNDSLSSSVPVAVGIVEDTIAEVSGEALHPGMSVVVTGNYALADSTRVTVTAGNAK
jgi:multidrug efflux pump subunit AcrA (membrane-fusion protein)